MTSCRLVVCLIGHWDLVIGHLKSTEVQIKENVMNRRSRRHSGFTLMEILLVLAILVVLGAMVGVGYNRVQINAMKNAAKTQVTLLEEATKLYTLDVGSPPSSLEYLITQPPDIPNPAKWQGPYLEK